MVRLLAIGTALLSVLSHALSTPVTPRRPLVIWHGMGDSYGSRGMLEFMNLIKEMHPGLVIHSVYIKEDLEEDQKAGFFGDVNEQLEMVADQLANITQLAAGFDAIGFSQGGQFLRAYVEKYNTPPINNLITFGSQHMGISDLPKCSVWDVPCQLARRAARGGVYTEWAQRNLVQAQYYRDAAQLDAYLKYNKFLPEINNELPDALNHTYADNLASLNALVLVLFSADTTVVPKETAWFGSFAPEEDDIMGNDEKTIVPMRLQPLYTHDWIGLRTLDESGRVMLETCEGRHMEISDACWQPLVKKYVGGFLGEGYEQGADALLRVQS
ncbi:alpha/beta-hydrolase [Daedaleopsis nitida]|nr:alpha/beta-hydrolase [Daedaleopsis nitida]